MEQLLVLLFLGLLLGLGKAKKKKNVKPFPDKPYPHPPMPVEEVLPPEEDFIEEDEEELESPFSDTISDSMQNLEEPEYVFTGMEASQEEIAPDIDTVRPAVAQTSAPKEEPKDKTVLPPKAMPKFSLRDAIVNQTILERKYH